MPRTQSGGPVVMHLARGEDFPVRISLADLRRKAAWRVQEIQTPSTFDTI